MSMDKRSFFGIAQCITRVDIIIYILLSTFVVGKSQGPITLWRTGKRRAKPRNPKQRWGSGLHDVDLLIFSRSSFQSLQRESSVISHKGNWLCEYTSIWSEQYVWYDYEVFFSCFVIFKHSLFRFQGCVLKTLDTIDNCHRPVSHLVYLCIK